MVFAVGDVEMEALQIDTATQRPSSSMAAGLIFSVYDFHLIVASEVIAGSHPEAFAQKQIGT